MPLKIYNTLTQRKEPFEPRKAGKVRMYVCGITAYDDCHLGHARAAVVFDVIYRYLQHLKYEVTYVRNFTDIDDKIINRSLVSGQPWGKITERYIESYRNQMKRLGVATPTLEPRATEHIQEMIGLISVLEKKGLAYQSGNDVFFEVRKFPKYGKLSHKRIDDLESGARVEIDEKKKDPLDFTLWKGTKPGEPRWSSPWGDGRPGWHIECSAMSLKHLGHQFDIHGGGRDLIFPHHENEIAQSEAATGEVPVAGYWVHNGFVNINAEKMSKSLGNIRALPAILDHWDAEVVRYFLLSAHYASSLDFTDEGMTNAEETLSRFYETLRRLEISPPGKETLPYTTARFEEWLQEGLEDDFNTTVVIGRVFEMIREINRRLDRSKGIGRKERDTVLQGVRMVHEVLGIFGSEPEEFLKRRKERGLKTASIGEREIVSLIGEREKARGAKDWQRADEIRKELTSQGVLLKDNPDGSTSWGIK